MSSLHGRGSIKSRVIVTVLAVTVTLLLVYGVSKTAADNLRIIGYFGRYNGNCIGVRDQQGFKACPDVMPARYSHLEVPDSFTLQDLINRYK